MSKNEIRPWAEFEILAEECFKRSLREIKIKKDCEKYEDNCPECYRPFKTVGGLERHIYKKHPEDKDNLLREIERDRI